MMNDGIKLYMNEFRGLPLLTETQEKECLSFGDTETLIKSNMRLVFSVANHYRDQGLSYEDLIQEGTLGLIKAIDKFDFEKGHKLSTYATWWIRQYIGRALTNQSRTVRIPSHMVEKLSKVNRAKRELTQKLDREPTAEEIGKVLKMDVDKVEDYLSYIRPTVSLEAPVGEEDGNSVGDFIPDETNMSAEMLCEYQALKEGIENLISEHLSEREYDVIYKRFGLDGRGERTLEAIGEELGVSRERVRQIERRALTKLRKPSKSSGLDTFMS